MAGIKNYKTIQQINGESFVPFLKKPLQKKDERMLIWHFPNKWQTKDSSGINYRSAIRKGEWKLI